MGGGAGRGEEKRKTKSNRIYRASENIRLLSFSWVTAVRVLSLAGSHSSPHLPRMPSNTVLVSGLAVAAAHILIWSYSCVFFLQCPQLSELVRFLLWGLSISFYIFHRHRVCLVDHVDLICSLYSWWEGFGFGSFSLATLPLGFNCVFISTSTFGSSTGV